MTVDSDRDTPSLTVTQFENRGTDATVSMDAVASLVHAFAEMVRTSTTALSAQITANAEAGRDRWNQFETILHEYQAGIERRLAEIEKTTHEHHAEQERRDIAAEARIKPVRSAAGWVFDHWRDLVLFAMAMVILATFLVETFGRLIGPHTP